MTGHAVACSARTGSTRTIARDRATRADLDILGLASLRADLDILGLAPLPFRDMTRRWRRIVRFRLDENGDRLRGRDQEPRGRRHSDIGCRDAGDGGRARDARDGGRAYDVAGFADDFGAGDAARGGARGGALVVVGNAVGYYDFLLFTHFDKAHGGPTRFG
jgi:hypothetical protein